MIRVMTSVRAAPDNFPLATDIAQTYYGIRPWRTNDALNAWTNALSIADSEVEREGVYAHIARLKTAFGNYDEAAALLNSITNENYAQMKRVPPCTAGMAMAARLSSHTSPAGPAPFQPTRPEWTPVMRES